MKLLSKRKFLLTLTAAAIIIAAPKAGAQDKGDDNYSVSALALYGWNSNWKSYGGLDLRGHIPVNKYFEANVGVVYNTPSIFSLTATARPKFKLPVGELYLDGTLHCRVLANYRSAEWVMAGSVGYHKDYFGAQLGVFNRTVADMDRDAHSANEYLSEPFNIMYKVYFKVRPECSKWNVGGGMTNFNEWQYERHWQPFFFIDGHYDFNDNIRLLADVTIEPTGTFHLNANFYGIVTRVGVRYKF
ncbi:MAG: hypothetical protein IJU69_07515 [Bacteroidales bacterium]|nr:hypothetical protein [Bacteroidales bacterium]